ncbi:MAG: hypothetical protein Q6373_012115 [Candidatus Sigynarchaeota archaeon]
MMRKKNLHFLHAWLTDPGKFFAELFGRLAVLSKRKQRLVEAITFLVPLTAAACLTMFVLKNAVVIVLYRFIPEEWAPPAYFLVFFLAILAFRGYHQALLHAKRFPRKKGRLSRFLPPAIPPLDNARNNLCMLPSLVVTACMALTYTGFTWNVYHYGFYLMFMYWFGLLWSGWMVGSSGTALPAINATVFGRTSTPFPATPERHVRRVMITTVIAFLLLCLAADAMLPFIIGAERLPLFFKVAYFFMHGN